MAAAPASTPRAHNRRRPAIGRSGITSGPFAGAPQGAFSLTRLFDKAEAAGRLYGLRLEGIWMHVGTPDAIGLAEAAIKASTG